MNDYISIIKSPHFQKYINEMRGTSHYSDFHLEGDVWSHTCMALNYAKECLSGENELLVSILFHDVGKIHTKNMDFKNHWFYSGNIFKDFMLSFFKNDLKDLFSIYKIIQLHHLDKFPQEIKDNLNLDISYKEFLFLEKLYDANYLGRITDKKINYKNLFKKYQNLEKENFNNESKNINFIEFEELFYKIDNILNTHNKVLILRKKCRNALLFRGEMNDREFLMKLSKSFNH